MCRNVCLHIRQKLYEIVKGAHVCMRKREREHAFIGFWRPAFSGLSSSYTMEPFMPPAVIIMMHVKCREVKEKKSYNSVIIWASQNSE